MDMKSLRRSLKNRPIPWVEVSTGPDRCDACHNTDVMMQWLKAGFNGCMVEAQCTFSELRGDTLGTLERVFFCQYINRCRG
jgi:hypothetical protein